MSKEQPIKIPCEIFSIQRRADQLFSFWQVSQRLNLNDKDRDLALSYTTERLLRIGVYETSSYLNSPIAIAMAKFGIFFGTLKSAERRDREKRDALQYQQELIESKLKENYADPPGRQWARTIELAVNDLIARATPPASTENHTNNMSLSNEQLITWTGRWQPQLALTTTPQPANS